MHWMQNAELGEAQALGGDTAGSAQNPPCCPGKGEAAPEEMVSSDEVVSVLNMVISAEIKTLSTQKEAASAEN